MRRKTVKPVRAWAGIVDGRLFVDDEGYGLHLCQRLSVFANRRSAKAQFEEVIRVTITPTKPRSRRP